MEYQKAKKAAWRPGENGRIIPKVSWLVLILSLLIVCFVIIYDPGSMRDAPYGAGDYYYTDLQGFEKIFFSSDGLDLGTKQLIIFFSLFFGWGILCWYFLLWAEKRK